MIDKGFVTYRASNSTNQLWSNWYKNRLRYRNWRNFCNNSLHSYASNVTMLVFHIKQFIAKFVSHLQYLLVMDFLYQGSQTEIYIYRNIWKRRKSYLPKYPYILNHHNKRISVGNNLGSNKCHAVKNIKIKLILEPCMQIQVLRIIILIG